MKIIVDTNRLIAAFIRDGIARRILFEEKIQFFTGTQAWNEFDKYYPEINAKSGLDAVTAVALIENLRSKITLVPKERMATHLRAAKALMDHVDPNDSWLIACALAIPNDGIWTEDKHFLAQDAVRVWSTAELLDYFEEQAQ